jgi:hypothetical protein
MISWVEDGVWREGAVWGESRPDGCVWVIPTTPEHREIAVLVEPARYREYGWDWRATWYEDHTRGDTSPYGTPHCTPREAAYGCVEDDGEACYVRCDSACELQAVRPGKSQCDRCDN